MNTYIRNIKKNRYPSLKNVIKRFTAGTGLNGTFGVRDSSKLWKFENFFVEEVGVIEWLPIFLLPQKNRAIISFTKALF